MHLQTISPRCRVYAERLLTNGVSDEGQQRLNVSGSISSNESNLRSSLKFLFEPEGAFFREFLMDEVVKGIDALSREQMVVLVSLILSY